MNIVAQPQIQSKVWQIANMEGTSCDIEMAIKYLLLEAQDLIQTDQAERYMELLSFKSLRNRLYPKAEIYGDDSLWESVNEDEVSAPSSGESEIL